MHNIDPIDDRGIPYLPLPHDECGECQGVGKALWIISIVALALFFASAVGAVLGMAGSTN